MPKITLENGKVINISQESYKALQEGVQEYDANWRAKGGNRYFACDASGVINMTEIEDEVDQSLWETGNYYPTEELAQKALERQKALMRIKRWCATNDPFEPDWSDKEQAKMEIFYNNERKCFNWCISYYTQGIAEIPYLSSSKKAKEFIKEMEDDLRLVFNV